VPLRAGSFYPGTENDAQAFRDVGLADRLQAAGCRAVDEGDLAIPTYLPHHALPPIRNWPAPRVVWDLVGERIAPFLRGGHVPLLIGCDCSIVVGTTQALSAAAAGEVHVLYLDGDLDDAPPQPDRSVSAAAAAGWLLTHDSPFWAGPVLDPSRVTVVGCDSTRAATRALPLTEVRRLGPAAAARQALDALPSSASVVLHFDIDIVRHEDLPAAYFPHAEGLGGSEVRELLGTLLADRRIRVVELTEYASLRDADRRLATQLADLLAGTLRR
jgi:arginase family enzyme